MKKNLALVTGGFSGEAVISYKTAATINAHLDREKYNVFVIDINTKGWLYTHADGVVTDIDKNDFTLLLKNERIKFDVVFIALHGTPGEDGKLQGYFDTLKIPYTSCDAATSAITFNKRYTTAVAGMAGIAVAKSVHLFKDEQPGASSISSMLNFPVFVKPNNGGSSIGMSKIALPQDLPQAIEKAFKEDNQVLVEEMITGREFTIGVFKKNNEIIALPMTEVISQNYFFDFEAKYEGKSIEITPAEVEDEIAEKVREAARKVYHIFNCRGVIRIDFIYNATDGKPYMLEVNTIPGQSEASIVPQQVKAMGWTLDDFYSGLIEEILNTK